MWFKNTIDSLVGKVVSGQDYKVATVDISLDIEDGAICRFQAPGNDCRHNLLWFCSKDIIFTTGYRMFNNNTTSPCQSLKYIDLIGGSINGNLEYFALNCSSLERINANFVPGTNTVIQAFSGCLKLKNPPTIDLNNVTSAYGLFYNCSEITEFDYYINNNGSITNAQVMFQGCTKLRSFVLNQKFDFSQATVQAACFNGCSNLISAPTITFGNGSADNFFYNCTSLVSVQSNINANNVNNIGGFFYNCSSLVDGPTVFDAAIATNINSLFEGCNRLETAPLIISFPKATTATALFKKCYSLNKAPTTITLPLATDIREMFQDCNRLVTPPNLIEAEIATSAYSLFNNCSMLTKAPATISLPAAASIQNTFQNCSSLINGPNRYYAPLATNAMYFFTGCTLLQDAGTNFTIGTNKPGQCTFHGFFKNCKSLITLPTEGDMHQGNVYQEFFCGTSLITYEAFENFCTKGLTFPHATSFHSMFLDSQITKIPLISGPQCVNAYNMCRNTKKLEYLGDIDIPLCTDVNLMFYDTGHSLLDLGKLNLSSMVTNNGYFDNLKSIKSLSLTGLRCNFILNNAKSLTSVILENSQANFIGNLEFQNCYMNEEALNNLFNSLPDRTKFSNKLTINIKGNPGAQNCNKELATRKN